MQSPLFVGVVAIDRIPENSGIQPNPEVLQVTLDTAGGTVQTVISLTVMAARQLHEALAKTLQALDSPT